MEELLLADQVRHLRAVLGTAREGSTELQFARHVLGQPDLPGLPPPADGPTRPSAEVDVVLQGYAALLGRPNVAASRTQLGEDLRRISRMNLFPADRHSLIFEPALLIGLSAAVIRAGDHPDWDAPGWLTGVLTDVRLDVGLPFLALARAYSLYLLTGETAALPRLTTLGHAPELGFAAWLTLTGAGTFPDRRDTYEDLAKRFVAQLLLETVPALTVPRAAVCLAAVTKVTTSGARRLTVGLDSVSAILRTFPACMRRWRWDPEDAKHPIRWRIDAEREVQDILWITLRPFFDDLEDEDPLPKMGHASFRPDLTIPSLRLLIEVKYARKASDFKELEAQVMVDSVAYLKNTDRYDKILVFIYDDSSSVEHHDTTRRALLTIDSICDVVIVSRPGRIPPRRERPGTST